MSQHMRVHLPFLAALLCLAGCGSGLRTLNHGAPVPWRVGTPSDLRAYVVSTGETPLAPPGYYGGLTDRERMVVLTARSFDLAKDREAQQLGWQLNEFCHLVDMVGDHWQAAYLVTGGDLNALCDDMPAEAKAAARARAEARRRARAEGVAP
jgi:hypothetical protein